MITFDEFKRLDLRVGKIVAVEDHPNADKLYVVKVDLGEEERQLVAGLRPYYEAEALVGKQVVVVANLEPAVLRGEESQGMLLAVADGPDVVILQPEREVSPGARIT